MTGSSDAEMKVIGELLISSEGQKTSGDAMTPSRYVESTTIPTAHEGIIKDRPHLRKDQIGTVNSDPGNPSTSAESREIVSKIQDGDVCVDDSNTTRCADLFVTTPVTTPHSQQIQEIQRHPHIETLNRIARNLEHFAPRVTLDEDTIVDIISKMNSDAFSRRRRRHLLTQNDPSLDRFRFRVEDECHWNDDDLLLSDVTGIGVGTNRESKNRTSVNASTKHLDTLVNVVDEDFFYAIIDQVEAESVDYLLDEDAIKNLRDSLSIRNGSKKRKRRDLRVKVPIMSTPPVLAVAMEDAATTTADGDTNLVVDMSKSMLLAANGNDSSTTNINSSNKVSHDKKRVTRGMTRDTRVLKRSEHEGLETVIAAMIDLERTEGRPTDILEEISQSRRLRNRNKLRTPQVQMVQNSGKDLDDDKLYANFTVSPSKKHSGTSVSNTPFIEVTKITVGGKAFRSPGKVVTRRKRKNGDEKVKSKKSAARRLVEDIPFSLSLLDWSNNNLPLKSSQKVKRALPMSSKARKLENAFSSEAIDATLSSWEALNNIDGVSDQQISLEPPRTRLHDSNYGSCCSELINCLQSSARVFARHEFFYSDIDKAWFNENPFHQDLNAHGIDPGTKLTRKEWGTIRRAIKKSRRRFTRGFIDAEFRSLNKYRNTVRKIQLTMHTSDSPPALSEPFRFEVLAPPRIGDTVTAYHHPTHLLHRGNVLCHDHESSAYLIQFEKKSLGYDWCADFEVASHGLPQVIYPSRDKAIERSATSLPFSPYGVLPSGTCYGTLIEFYNKEATSFNKPIHIPDISDKSHLKTKIAMLIERITEREALVKLMCMIELMIERKKLLLKAIDKCHLNYENAINNGDVPSKMADHKAFQEHYSWLHSNLKLNEASLEIALAQMQIIYGEAYTGISMLPTEKKSLSCKSLQDRNTIAQNEPHNIPWMQAVDDFALDVGQDMATRLISIKPSTTDAYTASMLSSAGGMLLTSDLIANALTDNDQSLQKQRNCLKTISGSNSSKNILLNQLSLLEPTHIGLPSEASNLLQARDSAFQALADSVRMFAAEISAQRGDESKQNVAIPFAKE